MATYNGVRSNNYRGKNVGLNPTPDGDNREFWNDRFVEPKQQHRFTVRMPIYTPVGRDKSTLKTAEYIKSNLVFSEEAKSLTQQIKDAIPLEGTGRGITSNSIEGYITFKESTNLNSIEVIDADNIKNYVDIKTANGENLNDKFDGKQVIKALNFGDTKTKASLFNDSRFEYISNDNEIGLYLRVSEYIAFSFKPPGFGYTPTNIGFDGQRNEERAAGAGDPSLSVANLTFVTTLRDDLHFSLGLLWSLSTLATDASSNAVKRSSFRLFPTALTGDLNDSRKELEIFEHYARQTKDGNGNSINGINDFNVSGIHRLKDPVIQSVDFSEYTYGGTELVKVSLTLGYDNGTSDDENKKINQSNFYSYQITEDRYGQGEVYAMDQGSYVSGNPYYERIYGPVGRYSDDGFRVRGKYILNYNEVKENRRGPSTTSDLDGNPQPGGKTPNIIETERNIVKDILKGNNTIEKNELVTKGISSVIQQRDNDRLAAAKAQADAEQRAQPERDRRARQAINAEQSLGAGASAVTSVVPD
jgi:hypothetical protein